VLANAVLQQVGAQASCDERRDKALVSSSSLTTRA
jgi:hypothetical protein